MQERGVSLLFCFFLRCFLISRCRGLGLAPRRQTQVVEEKKYCASTEIVKTYFQKKVQLVATAPFLPTICLKENRKREKKTVNNLLTTFNRALAGTGTDISKKKEKLATGCTRTHISH